MKKARNLIGYVLMYLGAWVSGMKYVLIAAIVLVTILESCSTQKNGCGSYSKWESKHSFNK